MKLINVAAKKINVSFNSTARLFASVFEPRVAAITIAWARCSRFQETHIGIPLSRLLPPGPTVTSVIFRTLHCTIISRHDVMKLTNVAAKKVSISLNITWFMMRTISHSSITLTCLTFVTAMLPCNGIVLSMCKAWCRSNLSLVCVGKERPDHMSSFGLNISIHRSAHFRRATFCLMTPASPIPTDVVQIAPAVRPVVCSCKLVTYFVRSNCRWKAVSNLGDSWPSMTSATYNTIHKYIVRS